MVTFLASLAGALVGTATVSSVTALIISMRTSLRLNDLIIHVDVITEGLGRLQSKSTEGGGRNA